MSFVHEMLSVVHAAPSAFGAVVQPPAPSHADDVWQSVGVQVYPLPPQEPAVHASLFVHALPSSHEVPFAFAGFEQAPVPVLHVPTSWH